jgi:NAD-dependent dihydropyrimidine dehydrogenase PreA subunit
MFDFDPSDEAQSPSECNKIDTQESAVDRQMANAVIRIDFDFCEATGVCAEVCPEDVLESVSGSPRVVKPEACTECWICVENCVSGAIEIG